MLSHIAFGFFLCHTYSYFAFPLEFVAALVFGFLPEVPSHVRAGLYSSLQYCSAVASVQGFCNSSPLLASSWSVKSLRRYQWLRNAIYSYCWFSSESLAKGAKLQRVCRRLDSDKRTSSQLLSFVGVGGREQGTLCRDSVKSCQRSVLLCRLEALQGIPQLCFCTSSASLFFSFYHGEVLICIASDAKKTLCLTRIL